MSKKLLQDQIKELQDGRLADQAVIEDLKRKFRTVQQTHENEIIGI